MKEEVYIITAASGNATAIQVLDQPKSRSEYADLGRSLIADNQAQAVEQAGFLIRSQNHFEMSGSEFCGNAARAAAILFSRFSQQETVEFTMSGFKGVVQGKVKTEAENQYFVECRFPGMPLEVTPLAWEQSAAIVDLGGIVHVVIAAPFPQNYEAEHRRISQLLNLSERSAVGVVWARINGPEAEIDPVVWVKEVDTFFYESSCGSGSIAAAKFLGVKKVQQPTGQPIEVLIDENSVTLKSQMEVKND